MKKAATNMLFPSGIKCIVCDSELSYFGSEFCRECSLVENTSFCFRCGRAKKMTLIFA